MGTTRTDVKEERLRNLLRDMIDIYSPSGKEKEIVDLLESYLLRAGLPVVRQSVEEERDNLLVLPERLQPSLVLVGHVDTVAASDYESYKSVEEDDQIIGLGAADMKGGCAAMIEALICAWQGCETGVPAALALVVGEEEAGDGASALIQEQHHFPWAIVGEPTNLVPCLSHYGYIELALETRGSRVHASLADQAHNAIRAMLEMILEISEHLDAHKPEVIYNIRDFISSQAGFVVPDRCEAWMDLHLPAVSPIGELAMELEEVVSRSLPEGLRPEEVLTFSTIHAGYRLPDRGLLPDILRGVYRSHRLPWKPGFFRSHSDGNVLWGSGIKPIILGPGQLEKAHRGDESVAFHQVAIAAALYLDVIRSLSVEEQSP